MQTLERKGKTAGSKAGTPQVGKDGVVAAARGYARGDALGVALEDDARVVVEAVDDREVKAQTTLVKEVGELCHQGLELGGAAHGGRHVGAGQKVVDLVDDIDAAVHARDCVQSAGSGGLELGRGVDQLVQGDEVRAVDQGKDLLAKVRAGGASVEKGRERGHRAKGHAPGGNAQGVQNLGQKADDLNLGGRAVGSHKFDAQLSELTGLAAKRLLLTHHGGVVPKAGGQLVLGHVTRD